MLMMPRLATCVLGPALACGVVGAEETFVFVDSGQTLGDSGSRSVALGDLDGDGDLDAMIANGSFSKGGLPNSVWTNDGDGIFTNSGQALGNGYSKSVALGDLDGDGDLDAMVANYEERNTVWTNNGNGTFSNSGQALGDSNSFSVALGDLDDDGDLDAMVANGGGQPNGSLQPNTVWFNDGTGTFINSGQALGNSTSWAVALGDLDGDGDLDAMVGNRSAPNHIWMNDGTGTFTNSGQALGNSTSWTVALGDLDGDGDLDAFVANGGPNTVWFNDGTGPVPYGTGTFTDSGQALGNSESLSVALGDLDGDGDLDAMVANLGVNTVWTNDRTGTFTNSGQELGSSNSASVALGDLDGDGDLDAMVTNYLFNEPNTVWFNRPTCLGDINSDGQVDGEDLTQVIAFWGSSNAGADLNGDGVVKGADLTILLSFWGTCP